MLPSRFYALSERVTATTAGDFRHLCHPPVPDPEPPTGPGVHRSEVVPPGVTWFERAGRVVRPTRRRLVVRHESDHGVIAAIELVIPESVSDARDVRRFAEKAVAVIETGAHLLVIDPFPPPAHAPGGLHASIWKKVAKLKKGQKPFTPPADRPLVAASYCAKAAEVVAAVQTFAVGEPVPDIPLYLTADEAYVTIPLEATYAAAFPEVPKVWRDVLES